MAVDYQNSFWFFTYLERERGYEGTALFVTMAAAVLVLAAGYPVGGALGDSLFKRTPGGRAIVATIGVLVGAVLMALTLNVPAENQTLFLFLLAATAFFIPFSAPNVVSIVSNVTLPEVRSTAISIQYLIESAGAGTAILGINTAAWLICGAIYLAVVFLVPRDIATLRHEMQERAEYERSLAAEPVSSWARSGFLPQRSVFM